MSCSPQTQSFLRSVLCIRGTAHSKHSSVAPPPKKTTNFTNEQEDYDKLTSTHMQRFVLGCREIKADFQIYKSQPPPPNKRVKKDKDIDHHKSQTNA